MRKIKLIIPIRPDIYPFWIRKIGRAFRLTMPLLAAYFGEEFKVEFIDEDVDKLIIKRDTDIAAISILTSSAKRGYEIADSYRTLGVTVIVGGMHSTFCPEEAKEHADAVIIGECEGFIGQLIDDLKTGHLKPFYPPNKQPQRPNMNFLLIPDRSILRGKTLFSVPTVQVSRGCPCRCEFCSVVALSGSICRFRPIKEVVREIASLQENWFAIMDDNLFSNKVYALKLASEIRGLKKKWFTQMPASFTLDRSGIREMARSGLRIVGVGFESLIPNSSIPKLLIGPDRYLQGVENLHDEGIFVDGLFVVGFDWEDSSVFGKIKDFADKARLDRVDPHILTPYPGTPLFERLTREKRILTENWQQYDTRHVVFRPKKMGVAELQRGFFNLVKELNSIRSVTPRLSPRYGLNSLHFLVSTVVASYYKNSWARKKLKGLP